MRFNQLFILLVLLTLLAAACVAPTAVAPTTAPSSSEQGYQPLSADACATLQKTVANALQTEATTSTAAFTDMLTGVSGQSCLITVTGDGAQFGSMTDVATALQSALAAQGWAADAAYAADGPTGTAFGLRQGKELAQVNIGWQPAADANCPSDQPISACELTPAQQLYTITVQAAVGP